MIDNIVKREKKKTLNDACQMPIDEWKEKCKVYRTIKNAHFNVISGDC